MIPTVKEVPADAEVPSHQLMIRSGLMRKLASGTYTYLLTGWRVLLKVTAIVREEMNRAGAQEILMPSVHPRELWIRTGRDADYGETLGRFTDRHGRENVLSPTAEEVVTTVAADELHSYKQMPFNLYQISFKFRDEFRPRFGVLRSREFIMKDAYSFHASEECLDKEYRNMYDTYSRISERCGLKYVVVNAESGEMGGSGSHQFTVPCATGEEIIVHTEDGQYAANLQKAAVDPVVRQEAAGEIGPIEEVHTPHTGTIEGICELLQVRAEELIKTLIYTARDETVVVLVRGDHEVNVEKCTQLMGGKLVDLADEETIVRITGAAVGFAGPMGLAQKVDKILIDHAAAAVAVAVTGANMTDYHVKNVVPGRDFPLAGDNIVITDVRNAVEGDTYQGKKLIFDRGIEIGQVFKLGNKYSTKLGAKYTDEHGREHYSLMGCYGIGINRIAAAAIEIGHDEDGIIWPISIAPFEVLITTVNTEDEEVVQTAEKIYQELLSRRVEVLLDDRALRGGVKFKDADLIGIPIRITVGRRALDEGKVEIKLRREKEKNPVAVEEAPGRAVELVGQLYEELKPAKPIN